MTTRSSKNCYARLGRFIGNFIELIVIASRVIIVGCSLYMWYSMRNQSDFSFYSFERFAFNLRTMLVLNVIYSFISILNNMTLVWEKASEFNDLISEVTTALGPFCVFLTAYVLMFFAAFYMFGQQQVGFNYYYKKN